jgi:Arc/MetJ-type ribon-helix-helix transcriptional regulator
MGSRSSPQQQITALSKERMGKRAPMMPSSDNGSDMRTIVDLPEVERAQLDALCRQRGLSRAEALRQALRLWLEQQKPSHGEVFGLWRDRPQSALELQQALRQEWKAP